MKKKDQENQEKLFTARVPAELLDDFKKAAKNQDETASQAFRKFMKQYVKQANLIS